MTDIEFETDKLMNIFHPYAMDKMNELQENNTRLVQYTSAKAAMEILKTKTYWMRKTSCMNDFMEVKQGLDCFYEVYRGETGQKLQAILNSIFGGITDFIENLFRDWDPVLQNNAYISCFSEHPDTEDMNGRLSMWRAYSESTGVALVFNNEPFLGVFAQMQVDFSPVAYLGNVNFRIEFEKVVNKIEENRDFLRSLGREMVIFYVFNAFKFAVLCTKHPGFYEENEWRLIYTPTAKKQDRLKNDIEVLRGTPQPVYKIPLENFPEEGLVRIEIPEILDRVLIGPTEYPAAIREAFVTLLTDAEVEDPADRVWVTGIPLRHH